jgi:hypothetical protein
MGSRPALEQAVINNVKMARTIIRARHSIEADDELNRLIPSIRTILMSQAQNGQVTGLSYTDLVTLITGKAPTQVGAPQQ